MNIKTKFNIGDAVFFMDNNKVASDHINGINIYALASMGTSISYRTDTSSAFFPEERLFSSKQELLESL